jgi:hypothetical protein
MMLTTELCAPPLDQDVMVVQGGPLLPGRH